MMRVLKELFGVAPTLEHENVYSPSKIALKMAVSNTTDYDFTFYENKNEDPSRKILVIGTEKLLLQMENGKKFLTGNHPVELFVPLLHLEQAGFTFDFATPTGQSLKLEHWAMPTKDEEVIEIYEKYKANLFEPLDLRTLSYSLDEQSPYSAVFIPGGHGAVIDLPNSEEVKRVIEWCVKYDKFMISICHGPAAFLAAMDKEDKSSFPYNGYEMVAFPDSMDKILPPTGYLPGKMPMFFGKELKEAGVTILNKKASGRVHRDRKLITGDSPNAANALGKLAAEALLEEISSIKAA